MAQGLLSRDSGSRHKMLDRQQKRKRDALEMETIEQAILELDPKEKTVKDFTDLPLSAPTRAGLRAAHFAVMTDIQAHAIPLALKGADILGAAKTGSGKTLSFVVPVLENLYRAHCVGPEAGLGAMIISPTRELAIQIFEVFRKVGGKGHLFAAGLVIGGKSLQEEQGALTRMNIVVCTPGRILQHLSQTAAFNVDNLKMLVLDEADRILDMGFQKDVDAIIEYLPKKRQTLLFSATQTKKVSDLARLSLQDPEYVSVHETATTATPQTLEQNYVITPLPNKLDTLWSFLQASKKSKILVFLSSGKQVRFVYESFRRLQPGIPLLHLHGRQKQTARLDITSKFSSAKYSCLFATDVVARGLDFPAVDWVIQVDCPEDADTYVHRVGRTARYEREGRAVLFLDPSEEEGMLKRLERKKVPIEKINVRAKKQQSIKNQLENLCFKETQLKYLGQKAFISYVKSIYLQKDKEIFDIKKLSLEEFSSSLGLPGAPRIKFMKGDNVKELKNAPRQMLDLSSSDKDQSDSEANAPKTKAKKKDAVRTKYDRMFERRNQDVFTDHYTKLIEDDGEEALDFSNINQNELNGDGELSDSDGDDGFLSVKRRIAADDDLDESHDTATLKAVANKKTLHLSDSADPLIIDSKRREKLLLSKKKLLKFKGRGTRLVFDDDGNAHQLYELEDEDTFKAKGAPEEQRQRFLEEEREKVRTEDVRDKEVAKEKKRLKKEKRKTREAMEAMDHAGSDEEDGEGVQVANADGKDAFAEFLADTAVSDEEDMDQGMKEPEDQAVQDEPKTKKWFQDGSEDDSQKPKKKARKGKKAPRNVNDPETLEDLEALASGLLAA